MGSKTKEKQEPRFLGAKQVSEAEATDERTPGGTRILKVSFEDGTEEHISELMYEVSVTGEASGPSELRDRRCKAVVAIVLAALREWGVKASELGYFSALLNASLDANRNAALNYLWGQHGPKLLDPDDVSLITIDRVLRLYGKDDVAQGAK